MQNDTRRRDPFVRFSKKVDPAISFETRTLHVDQTRPNGRRRAPGFHAENATAQPCFRSLRAAVAPAKGDRNHSTAMVPGDSLPVTIPRGRSRCPFRGLDSLGFKTLNLNVEDV